VAVFVLLAYAISWTLWLWAASLSNSSYGFFLRMSDFVLRFRAFTALAVLGNFGPGVAAILLSAISGEAKVRALVQPLLFWRVNWKWYLFAIGVAVVIPSLALTVLMLSGVEPVFSGPWYRPLRLLAINLFLGPIWEEIGWRGYLLPRLQASLGATVSSICIGIIWGAWHLPFYLFLNPIGTRPVLFFCWFVIACLPLSILFTLLYNKTRGSLLVVTLFHGAFNAVGISLYSAMLQHVMTMFIVNTFGLGILAILALVLTNRNLGLTTTPSKEKPLLTA
jgi:uncharacterized protein